MAVHVNKRKGKPADQMGQRAPGRSTRAEDSNRADHLSSGVKRAVRPAKRELDADGLLEIARTISPETGRKLEEFFEARSKRQLELQRHRSRSGA